VAINITRKDLQMVSTIVVVRSFRGQLHSYYYYNSNLMQPGVMSSRVDYSSYCAS
jgi:hypothetical protein